MLRGRRRIVHWLIIHWRNFIRSIVVGWKLSRSMEWFPDLCRGKRTVLFCYTDGFWGHDRRQPSFTNNHGSLPAFPLHGFLSRHGSKVGKLERWEVKLEG